MKKIANAIVRGSTGISTFLFLPIKSDLASGTS